MLAVALAVGLAQLSAPVAAAGLPARTVSPAPAGTTGPLDPLVPDAASLTAVAAQLPSDPVDAAEALVGTIFGADDVAAVAATGELLRRAGLPLVSATGPVVALPDGLTIISDPLYVEQLPALTRSVRDHTEFTPAQLSDTLQYIGVTTTALPAPVVVGMLAAWGKDGDAPAESAFAGAAVRALAKARGELLVPAALVDDSTLATLAKDPGSLSQQQLALLAAPGRLSGLDPVQFLLAVAHASGEVVGRAAAAPGPPAPPGLRRPGVAAAEDCQSIKATPEEGRAVGKKILRDDIKAGADVVKEGAGDAFDKGFDAYDKGTDVVATTMLLLGATIDLVASPPATHFRHESGDPSRDVLFVANAAFSSPIAAKRLACWSLAGVDVPPNGPLNGFRVRWEVYGSLPVLQTKHSDSDKLLHGELTNQGVSTLWMYPRTETHPPKSGEAQPQQTVSEIVVASLDKDDFPFKLTDLLGMANPESAALGKAWDIAVAWMQKVGLPSKRMRYPVTFHTNSPYVITAHTTINALGFADVTLDTDLYSCEGPGGPWKGSVTLTGNADAVLIYAGQLVGADTSKTSGSVSFPMNFTLNEKTSQPQQVPFGKDLALVIGLYPDQVQATEHPETLNDTWDRLGNQAIVGDGSLLSGGIDLRTVAGTTAGGLIQGEEYQVVGVMRDGRCPGASYWDDRFDND
jgi:hypothetical protein